MTDSLRDSGRAADSVGRGRVRCMAMLVDAKFLYDTAQSAIAGVIAAVVAALLLESARGVRHWMARRRDVKYIRDLLIEGRKHVLVDAKNFYHEGMGVHCRADVYRVGLYNSMIRKLAVGLERWTPNLPHAQRKNVLDALDWYHKNLHMMKDRNNEIVFPELRDGVWPTREMDLERATAIFDELQSIRWLKLPPMH